MKIKNFGLKNKFIEYQNLTFDFMNAGVYKISGSNGSGKTSIMEKIVFGEYDVEFASDDGYKLWSNNRYALFSYIPQKITEYKISVAEYICKGNSNIKTADVFALLDEFELDREILNQKFYVLSGGEKKKIQIISGILKDTSYIFIDEPTNNLDNNSVKILSNVLMRLSERKVIVLISHDERLQFDCKIEYCIDGHSVSSNIYDVNSQKIELTNENNKKPKLIKTVIPILKSYSQILTVIILIGILVYFAIISHLKFSREIGSAEIYYTPDVIFVEPHSYLVKGIGDKYIEAEGLDVDENLYTRYLTWYDIYTDISKKEGIENIYIIDFKYEQEIYEKIQNNTIGDEIQFVSYPQAFYENYPDRCSWVYTSEFYYYIEGKIPTDNSYEVAISKKLLIDFFGYNEGNVDNAIGDTILLETEGEKANYTIVGFSYFDYAVISYRSDRNYGVYCYNEDTFETFADNQDLYKIETKLLRVGMAYDMIIVTKDGYERNILNYLYTHYPAGEIYSYYCSEARRSAYISKIFVNELIPNIVVSIIFSIAFLFINRQAHMYNTKILEDFGNYYINKKKLFTIYKAAITAVFLIASVGCIIFNSLYSEFAYLSNLLLAADASILLIPQMLYLWIKKGDKERSR